MNIRTRGVWAFGWLALVGLGAGCNRPPFVVLTVEDPGGIAAGFAKLASSARGCLVSICLVR
jgi:hypothetical protein